MHKFRVDAIGFSSDQCTEQNLEVDNGIFKSYFTSLVGLSDL